MRELKTIAPISEKPSQANRVFWFSLSLLVAVLYGVMVLKDAFKNGYIVQDDFRQQGFWMRRFLDPQLFPHDLIADYFQSVAPWGFANFYRLFAVLGVDPLLLNKLLPPVLAILSTIYGFGLCLQLLPIPFAGFLASVLLNQTIWSHDDIASGTARAFMEPIFLAFLYYFLRRDRTRSWWVSLVPCLVAVALEGLFYPQYVFVFVGLLLLQPLRWQQGRLRLSTDKRDYWFCAAGLIVAFLVMLPFALSSSEFGPVITAAEAKKLPEFDADGRGRFFLSDPGLYWLTGNRSGVFPTFKPPLMGVGIFLPLLLRAPARFPLARQVSRKVSLLGQIVLVAFVLFFAAHALLFKLHLPSRYTSYTLRFALVFAAAIALTLLLDAGLRWLRQSPKPKLYPQAIVWGGTLLVAIALLFYPNYISPFPSDEYRQGERPQLYQFFAQQPKDTLIASLADEVNDLPVFSERSILVGREYAIPYHKGYANQFRQRADALIQAHYTLNAAELAQFTRTYGIKFWLVSRGFFQPDFLDKLQFKQYPQATAAAKAQLQQGTPVLAKALKRCSVFKDGSLLVLQAECVVETSSKQ